MRKTLALVVLLSFSLTACTGSFNLTKKVYEFHRSQSEKWADEILFLIVAITPIYSIATFADAVIFNTIEFWTGDNPVAFNKTGETQMRVVKSGDETLIISYNPQTDQITITPESDKSKVQTLVLERTDQMVYAKNAQGEILFSSVKNDKGDVLVYNTDGKLLKDYSSNQIDSLKESIARN